MSDQCNCDPPACLSLRRSDKHNENFRRLYYCCRNFNSRNGKGCGFFMWQEDAQRLKSEGGTVTRPRPNQTHDNNRSDSVNTSVPLQARASQKGSQNSRASSNSNQQSAARPNLQSSATETIAQQVTIDSDGYNSTCLFSSQCSNGSQVMPDHPDDIDANDIDANDIDANDIDANDIVANDIVANDIVANDTDANDTDADDIYADNIDDEDDSTFWERASQLVERAEAAQAVTLGTFRTAQPSSYRPISAPVFLGSHAAGNHERAEGSNTTVPPLSYSGRNPKTPTRAPLIDRSSSPPRSPRYNSHDTATSTSWARVPQRDVTSPPQQSPSRGFIHSAAAPTHPSTPTRGGGTASTSLVTPQRTPIRPGAQNFQTATRTAPPQFQLDTPVSRPQYNTPTSRPGAQNFQTATRTAPPQFQLDTPVARPQHNTPTSRPGTHNFHATTRPLYSGTSIAESSPFGADRPFSHHPALSEVEEYLKVQDRKVIALTKSKEALTRRNEDLVKKNEDLVKEIENLMRELRFYKEKAEEEKRENDALKAAVIKVENEALKRDRRPVFRDGQYDGDVGWGGSGFSVKRPRRTSSSE